MLEHLSLQSLQLQPYCSPSYFDDTGDHILDVRTSWVCQSSALLTTASDYTLSGHTVSGSVSRPPRRTKGTTSRGRRRRGVYSSTFDTAGSFSTHDFCKHLGSQGMFR